MARQMSHDKNQHHRPPPRTAGKRPACTTAARAPRQCHAFREDQLHRPWRRIRVDRQRLQQVDVALAIFILIGLPLRTLLQAGGRNIVGLLAQPRGIAMAGVQAAVRNQASLPPSITFRLSGWPPGA
jgi:hypothetical protein